jgi:NodT family efflux transporter outer membrane factor (OMF) lipoprotein
MRRTTIFIQAVILAAPLALGGCALKTPPSQRELARDALPNVQLPPSWSAGASRPDPVAADWLEGFGEPRLAALVAEALAYNSDLRVGAARVEQAAAALKIAGAALVPAVDVLGRANHKVRGGGSTDVTGVIVSASWEIDVWGRIRYGERAAREDYGSTQSDLIYARQSIAALVAKSWLVAAEASLQRQIALDSVAAGEKSSELARVRARVGSGDDRDVALAAASLQTYRDTLRQLDLAREQALRALEILAGRYPAATLDAANSLPSMPPPVAAGVPSQLLERRPDVIAAERRVAAAFNRVEEAKAALLPRFSLTAAINWIHSTMFLLKDASNPGAAAGGLLRWPLFSGGELEGQVEARTAEQKRAVADYAAIGLKAFNEVESALATEAALVDRERLLRQAVVESERTVKLSEVQFRVGRIDQRAILTDQLQLYATRVQLIRVQAEALAQRVNLHLALGGGIGQTQPPAPPTPPAPPAAAAPAATAPKPGGLILQMTPCCASERLSSASRGDDQISR